VTQRASIHTYLRSHAVVKLGEETSELEESSDTASVGIGTARELLMKVKCVVSEVLVGVTPKGASECERDGVQTHRRDTESVIVRHESDGRGLCCFLFVGSGTAASSDPALLRREWNGEK
jgi:hypothetical protein